MNKDAHRGNRNERGSNQNNNQNWNKQDDRSENRTDSGVQATERDMDDKNRSGNKNERQGTNM